MELGLGLDWVREESFYVLDNLSDHLPLHETTVFHLLNLVNSKGSKILVTCSTPIKAYEIVPDLQSRLLSLIQLDIILHPSSVRAILSKIMEDKQLVIKETVIDYLLTRFSRDIREVAAFLENLNARSLQQKRPISIPFIRQALLEVERRE